jgi:hypothetical protein
MTDVEQQRLNQIRARLRRITGNGGELSPKQLQSLKALVQELVSLESPGDSPVDDK